jgi:hypothetical protein
LPCDFYWTYVTAIQSHYTTDAACEREKTVLAREFIRLRIFFPGDNFFFPNRLTPKRRSNILKVL